MANVEVETTLQEGEAAFHPLADAEERRLLFAALDSLKQYRRAAHLNVTHRRRQNFYSLPSSHTQLLTQPPFSLLENLNRVDDAIDCNADIADAILEYSLQIHHLPREPEVGQLTDWQGYAKPGDVDKAHSTIRQLYRDWSAEGAEERKAGHKYVLAKLKSPTYSPTSLPRDSCRPKVLVPGAGLGRLLYEIRRSGYDVEGNEISYLQLLASSWVLNRAGSTPRPLYPFATQFSNIISREHQLRKMMVPDVDPKEGVRQALFRGEIVGTMAMKAADFVVLYGRKENRAIFDAVATVFFIDTAPNFLRYVDAVVNCLKPHGRWINVGPLLWHSDVSDNTNPQQQGEEHSEAGARPGELDENEDMGIGETGSFELTEQEVVWLLERKGFRFEDREVSAETVGYIQNPESMLQQKYHVSRWVAVKRSNGE